MSDSITLPGLDRCEPPTTETPLAEGLVVRSAGEALETVRSLIGEFRLLSSGAGTEVVQGALSRGGRLTLIPPQEPSAAPNETYFLLQGVLRLGGDGGTRTLGPGDYLVAGGTAGVHILEAVTDVQFLYVTSQPFFHEISDRIQALRELAVEVELKDGYTAGHCTRLQNLSYETGKVLGLPQTRLHLLESGSYFHDVGKVKVPLEILTKSGKLTEDEWSVIQQHPTMGRELLAPTLLSEAGPIVEQHHERLDGSGYPLGLAGDEIALEAYIVAVADTYDAMTTDRPYRKALAPEVSFAELDKYAGVHYPGDVVRAFREAVAIVEPAR